jgi:hypothetical protein
MFDLHAGAECGSGLITVLHHEFRPVPPAIKVEVTLPLPYIKNLRFEQTNAHKAILGTPPATKNRPAQLEVLRHSGRSTQLGRAPHATGRAQPIKVQTGKMT